MNKKKAIETAKEWIPSALRFSIFDSSDSMEDEMRLENRFNAFMEDTIEIEDFVKKNLYDEYLEGVISILEDEIMLDTWRERLKDTPSEFPIPFEKIERDLEKLINERARKHRK